MSAVDGMLKVMVESSGKILRLAAGSPARILDTSGTAHEASSQVLTRQEILQLIGPIVPEQARRRLPQETSVDFDYTSPSGPFKVTILRNGSEIVVSFVPDDSVAAAPPPSESADAPPAPADPVAHAAPVAPASP